MSGVDSPIRVMIVDDHDVVRRGLAVFLNAVPGLTLVAEAANGSEALQRCETAEPDVILMDVMMPIMDGIAATRLIRERHPSIQVVILTSAKDDQIVQNALKAGAIGYVSKDTSIEELGAAIQNAVAGKPTLGMDALQSLLNVSAQPKPNQFDLTQREVEILGLMAKGMNNPSIAERLTVSRSTVKSHISNILNKMGVTSRTEAVAIALQLGLIDDKLHN